MMLIRISIEILYTVISIFAISSIIAIDNFRRKEDLMTGLITFNLIPFITTSIPLFVVYYICKKYGINESMPICSCAAIKKSYQKNLDQLPEDCRTGADPFLETPILIRNFHHIKHAIFAINIVASLIFVVLQMSDYFNDQTFTFQLNSSIWFVFTSSIVFLFFDKQLCLVDRDCDEASKPVLFNGYGFPQMG